jgi:myosin V
VSEVFPRTSLSLKGRFRYYMLVPSAIWQPLIQSLDLKKLCTQILEKTINDPDKYQNGLTKIFFRAGMLAVLESLRANRLNALVTVVQKNMRRRMAVKKYRTLRAATIRVQTWWRGILARRFVENVRREAAAIRLQTGIRTYLQRKRFLGTSGAMKLFQSRKSFQLYHTFSSQRSRATWCAGSTEIQGRTPRSCRYPSTESHPWHVCDKSLIEVDISR